MSRTLWPRKGESLRDAEIRWQLEADPMMRDAVARGESRTSIGRRFGITRQAVGNALRRQAKRDAEKGSA